MIERPFLQLPSDTEPRTWLGANFWSRVGGPLMWRTPDINVWREELRVLREHGLNITRSFFYWPDFMPAPDTIDETYVARYGQFLDTCQEVGIATIPTFIVGHMSGENWDVAWRGERNLYSDGWMLAQQAFFIRELVSRFKDHPAVAGWLLSNEVPIYGGQTTPEMGRSWAQLLTQAVRAAGATQPVSTGDGAWGIEVTGRDNGFRLREIARTVDFLGPHVYPLSNDLTRQHLTAAFNCELCHVGKPVVLEEFGVTTDFTSEKHAGDYYRQVLHTSLLAGSVGWIAWNNTDFDLTHQDPYRHHPFELHFGITTTNGTPKAPLLELQQFRQVLDEIDITHCHRSPTDIAVIISSYFDTDYPFTSQVERQTMRDILLQSYVVTREADTGAAYVRELDGVPRAKLILVPSTKQLTSPTWEELEARAIEGATVYVSYFPGSVPVHRGSWHPFFDTFFGIEHQLRYGLVNPVEDDIVTFAFSSDFGTIAAGEHLSFVAAGNESGRVFLPCIPTEARVIATDAHSHPALLERAIGNGRIVLCTYPLEYFAASRPNANPDHTYQLYRALTKLAKVELPVSVDNPLVLADSLVADDGTRFAWFISESDQPLSVTPHLRSGKELVDVITGEHAEWTIKLAPFGVKVYRVI
ncbi:MAG TPA: cellulase family glycosylhydrolase [Ktedonobacteraceae bacterium]|nr:cellulase family glycosylhydrolase [Ktedonobacteraceae bacterium]